MSETQVKEYVVYDSVVSVVNIVHMINFRFKKSFEIQHTYNKSITQYNMSTNCTFNSKYHKHYCFVTDKHCCFVPDKHCCFVPDFNHILLERKLINEV